LTRLNPDAVPFANGFGATNGRRWKPYERNVRVSTGKMVASVEIGAHA
jgi:hypothetical protein